jgi:cytochrome subunit of sulfide dehydrogenase
MERRSPRRSIATPGMPRARPDGRAAALGLLALVLACAPAAAQPSSPAGAESCTGCHAPSARGTAIPAIDGRPAAELAALLREFHAGSRHATVMDRIARGFSPEELDAIAGWFAALQR